jgi:hypothetical protein
MIYRGQRSATWPLRTSLEVSEDFEPTGIVLVQSDSETLLVAQDDKSRHIGVVCPPDVVPTLQTFVTRENAALLRYWQAYEDTKGASAFLWDLISFAEGIPLATYGE